MFIIYVLHTYRSVAVHRSLPPCATPTAILPSSNNLKVYSPRALNPPHEILISLTFIPYHWIRYSVALWLPLLFLAHSFVMLLPFNSIPGYLACTECILQHINTTLVFSRKWQLLHNFHLLCLKTCSEKLEQIPGRGLGISLRTKLGHQETLTLRTESWIKRSQQRIFF